MSNEDIDQIKLISENLLKDNPTWRKGQAIWNAAELYIYDHGNPLQVNNFEDLRNSDKYCFYNDEYYPAFIDALHNV